MDIKDFLPRLRRMIQGPLQTMMADSLKDSAVSFCKESQILREEFDAGSVDKGTVFTVTPTDATLKPWGTVSISSDEGELKRNVHYRQPTRDKIEFLVKTKGVKVLCYLYPTDMTALPDLLDDHRKAICAGAAKEMYIEPGRPWTDPSRADYYSKIFVTGYRDAWREIDEQYGNFQNPDVSTSFWT